MKSPGRLITTDNGTKGVTYNSDHLVNGKLVVYVTDSAGEPIMENGKPKKILVDRSRVKLRGFVD